MGAPMLDVIALLVAAFFPKRAKAALAMSRVLGKLSMLDVSMMGTSVIVAALSSLRANGVIISLSTGMLPLAGAELCHYLIAFLASGCAAQNATNVPAAAAASKDGSGADRAQEASTKVVSKESSSMSEVSSEAPTYTVGSEESISSNSEVDMV